MPEKEDKNQNTGIGVYGDIMFESKLLQRSRDNAVRLEIAGMLDTLVEASVDCKDPEKIIESVKNLSQDLKDSVLSPSKTPIENDSSEEQISD